MNYFCEQCGKNFRDGGLDCSHNISRRHVATKWHPLCSVAHCRSCHWEFTKNGVLHTRWLDEYFGKELVDEMLRVSHTPVKWGGYLRDEIKQHYIKEYARMTELRKSGFNDIIDFEPHECMHVFAGSRPKVELYRIGI